VGEQNWVYYELGGSLERVKTAFAHSSSSPRTFFFLPTSEIRIPGGCLVFPLLEQIYRLRGGGVAELCISRGTVAGGATTPARTPTFTPLPKSPFGPKKCCLAE